jgi:hypothetical protein
MILEMEWRQIDTMMISKCIQHIENEINAGRLEASRFVPIPELKETRALMYYKAWRVHLVDRMMEEDDRSHSANDTSDPTSELEADIGYYKKVQEKERATRTEYDDY